MIECGTVQELGLSIAVNLCDSCCHVQPTCSADNLIAGDGIGNDNIAACNAYEPLTVRHPKDAGLEL